MNDQLDGQLRNLLQALGAILTTIGVLKPGIADTWIPVILQIIGPLSMVGGIVWAYLVNRPSSIAAAADKLPGVAGVVTTNTPEGRALADSVPSRTVATAGTFQAKQIVNTGVGAAA
jgi:hypothetical protein